MGTKNLTDRYADKIMGVLGCFDRVIIQGDLPWINYPKAMEYHLYKNEIKIFDYPKFALGMRNQLRAHVEEIAHSHGLIPIEGRRREIKKEEIAAQELRKKKEQNKDFNGLFCIIQSMESCPSFNPMYDKEKKIPYLAYRERQCLHYYFYFIDDYLGLCFIRVPTWLPLRLKVYFNGHNWLASRLDEEKIKYQMLDNCFSFIENFERAQQISDSFDVKKLHQLLDKFAQTFCPIFKDFCDSYHWSVLQAEYSTDIVFHRQKDLQEIYQNLVATAIHTVKPENIATFLGRKSHQRYEGEMGNHYHIRLEGCRVKHMMGPLSIKMYDKYQQILRIETTTSDIRFFQHYRKVDKRDGTTVTKFTSMKKYIYSIPPLITLMKASNRRYLEFISAIEDKNLGNTRLNKLTKPIEKNKRKYKGINFFAEQDLHIMEIISRGEFNLYGFKNKDIRKYFPNKNSGQISRLLKRIRLLGLIKKIGKTYKYYLTLMGKQAILTAMKIKELVMIPALNY